MSINKPEGDFKFTFPAPPGILFSEPIEVSYSEEDQYSFCGIRFGVKGAMGTEFSPSGETTVRVNTDDFWNTDHTDIKAFLTEKVTDMIERGDNGRYY